MANGLNLWNDRTAKDGRGSILRLQQQLKQQASEICFAHGGMECG